MLRYSLLLIGLVSSLAMSAQMPSGTWVMSYVRAKQPIFTMVNFGDGYELDSEVPQDSTFLYSPGLMSIIFGEEIKSYSWEGEESWSSKILKDSIYLFGQRDTLYGVFNDQKVVLSSTLDDRPTEYHFDPLDKEGFEAPDLLGYGWKAKVKGHSFDKQTLRFSLSPNDSQYNFKPLDLGNMTAFEYELPASAPDANDQEYGIVYLFQLRRNRIEGVFYPARDDSDAPTRKEIRLSKR